MGILNAERLVRKWLNDNLRIVKIQNDNPKQATVALDSDAYEKLKDFCREHGFFPDDWITITFMKRN